MDIPTVPPSSLAHPWPFADVDELFERCLVTGASLDLPCSRDRVIHEAEHVDRIRSLIDRTEAIAVFRPLIESKQIVERAVAVAGAVFGGTDGLDDRQLRAHRDAHLALMLEMLWMWVLDDTLDPSPADAQASGPTLRLIAEHIATGDPPGRRGSCPPAVDARQAALRECITALVAEYLAISPRHRSHGPVSQRMMRRFLTSYLRVHGSFSSWPTYETHRAYNSGLWSTALHAASFLVNATGHDGGAFVARLSRRDEALVARYCVLGGIANDLFGLGSDAEDGIASSFGVARALAHRSVSDVEVIHGIVELHNARLRELVARLRSYEDPATKLLLYSTLRSTWSLRVLHYEAAALSPPTALREALRAGRDQAA